MNRRLLVCASSVLLLLVPLEAAAQDTGSFGSDTFTSAILGGFFLY